MASKSSWRLKFIDIDTSFSISTEPGTVKGYMVVRAPKGETEPYYFDKGNQSAIEAYVGLGGSDYPDIEEAIAFNREYGIYISAPEGSSNEYPSYIGGKYITTEGLVDLYNVTSKENIDYMKMAKPSHIGETDEGAIVTFIPNENLAKPEVISVEDGKNTEAYAIVVSNISEKIWKDIKEVALNFGNQGVQYYLVKEGKLYHKTLKGVSEKYSGSYYRSTTGTYTVVLGGQDWLSKSTGTNLKSEYNFNNINDLVSKAISKQTTYSGTGELSFSKITPDDVPAGAKYLLTFAITDEEKPVTYTVSIKSDSLSGTGTIEECDSEDPDLKGKPIVYAFTNNMQKVDLYINEQRAVYTNVTLFEDDTLIIKNIKDCINEVKSAEIAKFSDNSVTTKGVPFFNIDSLNGNLIDAVTGEQFIQYFCSGFSYAEWMKPLYEFSLSESDINFKQYIKDSVLATIIQKSACEKNTKITLKDIGYDKWKYTTSASVLLVNEEADLDKLTLKAFTKAQVAPSSLVFVGVNKEVLTNDKISDINNTNLKLYEVTEQPSEFASLTTALVDVTEDYQTQDILINGIWQGTYKSPAAAALIKVGTEEEQEETSIFTKLNNPALEGRITLVVDETTVAIEFDEKDIDRPENAMYFLKPNINFGTITFSVAEGVYNEVDLTSGGTFTGSMNPEATDSYGTNIYWPNVLNENDFSFVEVIPTELDPFTNPALNIVDGGTGIYQGKRIIDDILVKDYEGNLLSDVEEFTIKGQRYVAHLVDENKKQGIIGGAWTPKFEEILKQGWIEALDANYDDVYVFMEPTGTESYKAMISSMLEGTHKLAIALSVKNLSAKEVEKPHTIKISARHKQHAQYAGRFLEYDSKTGRNYYVTPIGDIGKMCGRIYEKKMGGWAPAWYNYNSMGGQLDRAVLKAEHNFSDPATEVMDKKGLNPIIFNSDDGLMVVSSKTTQDPNNETDWSFLEHVMSFCLLKREIRDKVMRPQIKKPIDDYWMQIRQEQVDAILDERISGPNKIWTAATCDIKGVNNDKTKAQRKFCILVKVKTTKFAEIVELTLETVAQNATL